MPATQQSIIPLHFGHAPAAPAPAPSQVNFPLIPVEIDPDSAQTFETLYTRHCPQALQKWHGQSRQNCTVVH